MAAYLPDEILALFEPREMPEFKAPAKKRKSKPLEGLGGYIGKMEDPSKTDFSALVKVVTPAEKRKKIALEREEAHKKTLAEKIRSWDPLKDEKITSDPFKTLFVSHLSYATTPETLKRQFSPFGHINQVVIVKDLEGKPRGYGFIEFERERDMKTAYKLAPGMHVDGRAIVIDIERARQQKSEWLPRRLGGGAGRGRPALEKKGLRPSLPSSTLLPPPGRPFGHDERGPDRRGVDYREPPRGDRDYDRDRSHDYDRRDRDRGDRGDRDRDRDRDRGDRRDRDRDYDRRDRDRDHDRRDRDRDRDRDSSHRDRDRDRDHRDKDRDSSHRDRDRDRDRTDRHKDDRRDRDGDREDRHRDRDERDKSRH